MPNPWQSQLIELLQIKSAQVSSFVENRVLDLFLKPIYSLEVDVDNTDRKYLVQCDRTMDNFV